MRPRITLTFFLALLLGLPGFAQSDQEGEPMVVMSKAEYRDLVRGLAELKARRYRQRYAQYRLQGAGTAGAANTSGAADGTTAQLDRLERTLFQMQERERINRATAPAGSNDRPDYRTQQLLDEVADLRRQLDRQREDALYDRGATTDIRIDRRQTERLDARDVEMERLRNRIAQLESTPGPGAPPNVVGPRSIDTVMIVQREVIRESAASNDAELRALREELARLRAQPTVVAPAAPPPVTSTALLEDYPAILFANASADIPDNYLSVVRAVAEDYRDGQVKEVTITGYASKTGSVEFNRALSRRRAEAVERALVSAGVPASIIRPIYGGINYEYNELAAARRVNIRAILIP